MLSSELHNRTTFLPFNMETHLVSSSADTIDIVHCRDYMYLQVKGLTLPWFLQHTLECKVDIIDTL